LIITFFFQAEDGIRDRYVTGVQTCALPISTAGIVDPWQYALAMAEVAVVNGVELHRSTPATAITPIEGGYAVTTPKGVLEGKYKIGRASCREGEQIHAGA